MLLLLSVIPTPPPNALRTSGWDSPTFSTPCLAPRPPLALSLQSPYHSFLGIPRQADPPQEIGSFSLLLGLSKPVGIWWV